MEDKNRSLPSHRQQHVQSLVRIQGPQLHPHLIAALPEAPRQRDGRDQQSGEFGLGIGEDRGGLPAVGLLEGELVGAHVQQKGSLVEPGRHYKVMEVCGGHTHSIYKYGVDDLLPANVELVHGPGCPVCVIPMGRVDDAIQYLYTVLSSIPSVLLIAAFVLMIQVFIDKKPQLFETGLERADIRLDANIVARRGSAVTKTAGAPAALGMPHMI